MGRGKSLGHDGINAAGSNKRGYCLLGSQAAIDAYVPMIRINMDFRERVDSDHGAINRVRGCLGDGCQGSEVHRNSLGWAWRTSFRLAPMQHGHARLVMQGRALIRVKPRRNSRSLRVRDLRAVVEQFSIAIEHIL